MLKVVEKCQKTATLIELRVAVRQIKQLGSCSELTRPSSNGVINSIMKRGSTCDAVLSPGRLQTFPSGGSSYHRERAVCYV